MEEFKISNRQYSLSESIIIEHNIFGSVEILYGFYNISYSKMLAYQYKGFDVIYDVDWWYIQEFMSNQMTVELYFGGSLDFIYNQLKYLYNNTEVIKDMEEQDVKFLDFFKDKIVQNDEQKPLNDLKDLK